MVIVIINLLGLFMLRARIKGGLSHSLFLPLSRARVRKGGGGGLLLRDSASKEDRRSRRVNQSVDETRGVQKAS